MNTEITISPTDAILALEGLVTNYTLNSIRAQLYQRDHKEIKDRFEKEYGWCYWSSHDQATKLYTAKTFENRAAAQAWLNGKGLGKASFNKTSFVTSDGLPKTLCALKCKGEFEGVPFEVEATYTRDGLPTKSCRVEASINYSVVCNLDEKSL